MWKLSKKYRKKTLLYLLQYQPLKFTDRKSSSNTVARVSKGMGNNMSSSTICHYKKLYQKRIRILVDHPTIRMGFSHNVYHCEVSRVVNFTFSLCITWWRFTRGMRQVWKEQRSISKQHEWIYQGKMSIKKSSKEWFVYQLYCIKLN